MKKTHYLLFIWLMLCSFIARAQVEEELHALLDDYVTSVNNLDMELAEKIWSNNDSVSFIQPRGHQKGWDNIRDNFYLGAMANFKERDLKLRDITIQVLSDNTAWSEFYWDFDATFNDGTPIESSGRETQIWQRESDGWKIVHVHYSGMPVTGEREGF